MRNWISKFFRFREKQKTIIVSEDNISEFVRDKIVSEIEKQINKGESIKLVGLPKIGITSIMLYIHLQTTKIKEIFKNYESIYIEGRYNLDEIIDQITEQLNRIGLNNFHPKQTSFEGILKHTYDLLNYEYPGRKVLFILDDFQSNFKKYNANSLLDKTALEKLRNFAERKNDVSFIVNYKYPIQIDVEEDWYLNTFRRIEIKMLSIDECKELIKIKRERKKLNYSEEVFNMIYKYSGGYPLLIDDISNDNLENEQKIISTVERRYSQIDNYLKDKGSLIFKDKLHYIRLLLNKIKYTNTIVEKDDFINEYFVNDEKGNTLMFSQYFKEWISKKYINLDNKKINIFITYSSKDRVLLYIMKERLNLYLRRKRDDYDIIWTDNEILTGEDWDEKIRKALAESNLGILLVSPEFLGSNYSMAEEFRIMLEKRKNEGYLIIPILLRECDFRNNEDLRTIQFFKTYQSEYDVIGEKMNLLMPFDELAEKLPKPNERLLNRYFLKLANEIDKAVEEKIIAH